MRWLCEDALQAPPPRGGREGGGVPRGPRVGAGPTGPATGAATQGLGHVSWVVEDLEAESARLEEAGCALIHTASSGPVNVAWHRGGPLFPHPIEVHRAGRPILGMHARLSGLAAGWDGTDPLRPIEPPPEEVHP